MRLHTLIFDFDGTIADSFEATLRVANALAPEFGYRPALPEEVEELRGSSYRTVAAKLGIAWHKIPLIAGRIRRELSRTVSEMETFEALPHVLLELRRRGIQLGILTSNGRDNVERFLVARNMKEFDFISSGTSIWGKQRQLKSLLRSRGLHASEVAYVGDEVRDIEATKPLDVCMIAVGWGYTAAAHLAAHAPDYLIQTPADLLEIPRLRNAPGRGLDVE
jgi:phosphoglycolate phosphatase